MSDNFVQIEGNLTADPETRYTATGTAVTNFSVAVTRSWFDNVTQERKEETSFFDVTAWKDLGEHVSSSLSKGDRVQVTGRLKQQTWTTDGGDKRSKVIIEASGVSASLRWATAEVTKAQRNGSSSNGKAPAMAGAPGPQDNDFGDEEPF